MMGPNKRSRKQKLALNTGTSLLYEAVTVVCGLILPRLVLEAYGSEVNGLVHSIAQFLHIVAFLDLGVGSVVQSALYKPLADGDWVGTSSIIASAQRFFRRIAAILLVYVVFLMGVYPFFARGSFDWAYSALLVAAMGISSFAQYYFGVVDRLLLLANQEGYVQYTAQIATAVLNTAACAVIIKLGASIQTVKLVTSLVFLCRPWALRLYVNRHYRIDRHIRFAGEPLKQKRNGIAQHVSYVVLTGTDNIVLTLFSTLSNVSIYSVYHLVIYGIKLLFLSMTNGIRAIIGELWARKDLARLDAVFGMTEFALHAATVWIFTCTWKLILPFVGIYTAGITDAEYIQPLFAAVLVLAHAVHCLRIPYNMLILATGAYRESQNMHIATAVINIVMSVAAVSWLGLLGVAIGTLAALLYQTTWMVVFDSRNNIRWPLAKVGRQLLFDVCAVAGILAATHFLDLDAASYPAWFLAAAEVALVSGAVVAALGLLFYRPVIFSMADMLRHRKRPAAARGVP